MSDPGVISDLIELGGAGVDIVELGQRTLSPPDRPGVVTIGIGRGELPIAGLDAFDILLCDGPDAPAPWVGLAPSDLGGALDLIERQVKEQPTAATVAAQVLRMTLRLAFDQALMLESMAYSMLLASPGFKAWRAANPPRRRPEPETPRVLIEARPERIELTLHRPQKRNAFDARMRDELTAALEFALTHPMRPPVVLRGSGPAFSAGGDLDEFGQADDPGVAHLIRTLRSPARLAQALGPRLTVQGHGAHIGAGVEVAAAAGALAARPGSFFRLPEVAMGLIPGAGGTASIPRRIGRQRACYMAISGAAIDLDTALNWGLVDRVEQAP